MNILDKIVAQKQLEVAASKKLISIEELKDNAFFSRKTLSLKESVKNKSGIIAEFKRKSPSKGIINDIQNPLSVVSSYEKYGASGISILTDREFFGGSKEDILAVREHINIPFSVKIS
ncbi:Indole-3-glycerol phosphate synthase [Elizabethkingia miricola]|nr:Indole-3-glycerol phosphate synthase [Elizabethkingia miricola]